MEAVAHSPAFAKKAGVPQSVGKDFSAADKGRKFGKGGEMKESKSMMLKEVAFFKKKGAPKAMVKHEEAEMKGMKRGGKVRRMDSGGLTDSSGNPVLSGSGEQIRTGFSDDERKPAPIENRSRESAAFDRERDSFSGGRRPIPTVSNRSPRTRSGDTEDSDAVEREDALSLASLKAMKDANSQKANAMAAFNPALADAQSQAERAKAAFKPIKYAETKPAKPVETFKSTRDMEKGISRGSRSESAFPATRKPSMEDIPKDDSRVQGPYKGETVDNSKLKQFSQSMLAAFPALSGAGALVRGAARGASALGKMLESEPKTGSLKDKTIGEINKQRAADQDVRGPISTTPKSAAIQPTGKGPSEAGRELMQGRRTQSLKDKAIEEINAQRAATKDIRGDVGSKPSGRMGPKQATGKGVSEAGKKLMERSSKRSSTILDKEREPGFMQGEKSSRARNKEMFDDGLSTPRYENKKGGQIKAYAQGGKVKTVRMTDETMGPRSMSMDVEKSSNKNRAFGEHIIQKRGKTRDLEEKMPKFAKGGMVGHSNRGDGIASRGHTRCKMC
jgi:hypothetical protein